MLTPPFILEVLINTDAAVREPAREIAEEVVTNDPIVPPVTTTDTPALVPVACATEVAAKEIDPPVWITPVLVIPPATEVPIELTFELASVAEVLATQPTDVNGTDAVVDNWAAVGTFGVPSVSALVPITSVDAEY